MTKTAKYKIERDTVKDLSSMIRELLPNFDGPDSHITSIRNRVCVRITRIDDEDDRELMLLVDYEPEIGGMILRGACAELTQFFPVNMTNMLIALCKQLHKLGIPNPFAPELESPYVVREMNLHMNGEACSVCYYDFASVIVPALRALGVAEIDTLQNELQAIQMKCL